MNEKVIQIQASHAKELGKRTKKFAFRLGSYKQLPQLRMAEAVQYLVNLELRPAKKIAPAQEQKKLEA